MRQRSLEVIEVLGQRPPGGGESLALEPPGGLDVEECDRAPLELADQFLAIDERSRQALVGRSGDRL